MTTDRTPASPSFAAAALPISKLRGVPQVARVRLKSKRITNCGQLLEAAGQAAPRRALSHATSVPVETLLTLVQRADMARVHGIGAVFGMMLEDLGVRDVRMLAEQDAGRLHENLRDYNQAERIARRSPTPEEVESWVSQARRLVPLVTYDEES